MHDEALDIHAIIQRLIDSADGLIAAIEGVTDQFDPEVSELCAATSAAEKAIAKTRGRK